MLGRVGCHLCEQAREVVAEVAGRTGRRWHEVDVDTDPDLRAEWGDLVPVVLIDGICHAYYTIDPDRLALALGRLVDTS